MEFNDKDWPNDGTDWDGVKPETMKQILKHREIVDRVTDYALSNNLEELHEIIKGEESKS